MNITDKEYKELVVYIKSTIGIDLGENKKMMVIGRLRKVMAKRNIKTYPQLYKAIAIDKDEEIINILTNAITTNYTYFMRESEHFDFLKNTVLPEIKRKNRSRDLRVWCAASSTGEEPYTLAMVIDEVLGDDKHNWDRKLLATDISTDVLNVCNRGVYNNNAIATIPAEWRNRYFKKISPLESEILPELKNQVIFRRFNLMTEKFPFKKKFNVIFCRNVMIYFDTETRNTLINKFYDLLEDGGYLFIGQSESIDKSTTKFKYIMPSVYKKER